MKSFIEKIKTMFNKNSKEAEKTDISETWYIDNYSRAIIQRNRIFIVLIISIIAIFASASALLLIFNHKKFEPYVIAIDNTTGNTTMISPLNNSYIYNNQSLARYFIKKYVIARESYANATQWVNQRNVLMLSSANVYRQYLGYKKQNNPVELYGSDNNVYVVIKSWSNLDSSTYVLRVAIKETTGAKRTFNKIIVISYTYTSMELTDADFDINPVGFQVTSYSIDNDDNS